MFLTFSLVVLVSAVSTEPVFRLKNGGCGEKPVELFFLLDSSSSIWQVDFQKQLTFVNGVIDQFDVSPVTTRVGVASFSHSYRKNIDLAETTNKHDLKTKVGVIRQMFGGTNTDVAIDGVRRDLSPTKTRPGVERIAIVLTDGESFHQKKTEVAARKLKADGVTVFAIGVGGNTKQRELKAIASEPTEKYMFRVGNYGLLETIKTNLTRYACADIKDEPVKAPICGNNNEADVMFLVDPSELGYADTKIIYQFIGNLTHEFNMADGNIRIGLESQRCSSGDVRFGSYKTETHALSLMGPPKFKGFSHMLKRLRTHSFKPQNGGRIGARHMAILFVDDKLYNTKEILGEARRAKNDDVEIFVVAIGDHVNEKELKTLCSSSVNRHYIRVPSYGHLYATQSELLEKFCHGL